MDAGYLAFVSGEGNKIIERKMLQIQYLHKIDTSVYTGLKSLIIWNLDDPFNGYP